MTVKVRGEIHVFGKENGMHYSDYNQASSKAVNLIGVSAFSLLIKQLHPLCLARQI